MPDPARILVCDDHEVIRQLIAAVLEQDGYATREAARPDEALDVLAHEPVDLLVLDLRLGEEKGTTLVERLREDPDLAALPVVLVSGAFGEEDTARAAALGADAVLPKPFDLDALKETVRELLAG